MKVKQFIFWVNLLIFLIICQNVFAQRMDRRGFASRNQFGSELFLYKIYNFADTTDYSKSLVEFHFSIVNDLLTFIKTEDETFKAQYEINIIFYNKKNQALAENSIKNEIIVKSFPETNLRVNPYKNKLSVSLAPGEYYYIVQIVENSIPEILVEKTKITLRSFQRDRLHISDIVFVDKIDCSVYPVNIEPNIKNIFENSQSDFSAFTLVYPQENSDSLLVEYRISEVKGAKIVNNSKVFQANKNIIPYCISFKDIITKPGQYSLTVNVKSGKQSTEINKKFNVNWGKIKLQQNNFELAIEQLKLIAHKRTVAIISDAPETEKKALYDQFWKERDPTPDTPGNELQQEFIQRVNFANQNFSENFPTRDGWETDRGEIYIKYGPPTQVERQQLELSRPGVEIWYYAKLDRKYYFADRNGFGVYRLVKVE